MWPQCLSRLFCEAAVTDGQSTWFCSFFVLEQGNFLINTPLQPCCPSPPDHAWMNELFTCGSVTGRSVLHMHWFPWKHYRSSWLGVPSCSLALNVLYNPPPENKKQKKSAHIQTHTVSDHSISLIDWRDSLTPPPEFGGSSWGSVTLSGV